METQLEEFEQHNSSQVFVLIQTKLPPSYPLNEYVNDLFAKWQPGQAGLDNGVILTVFNFQESTRSAKSMFLHAAKPPSYQRRGVFSSWNAFLHS
jgi:uncharacterized membrane protein YgcG